MIRRQSVAALAALLVAAAAEASDPAGRRLTAEVLLRAQMLAAPLEMAEFAPPADAAPPTHAFAGRLRFAARGDRARAQLLHDRYAIASGNASVLNLPAFDFEFAQADGVILPMRRGPQPGRSPHWEWVLEPGRAWQEAGDGGLTRAAIPFALIERNANCLHYGVLGFLFGPNRISQVAFQMASETCWYFKFDLHGIAKARYTPGTPRDAAAAFAAHDAELRARLPVRPIEDLAVDHPGADPAAFGSPDEVLPGDMTVYGYVIDGVHYVGGCETRRGRYPYCDTLDLPSYSVAKSIFAGLALMRLERLYPGVSAERVADWVPDCARAGGWEEVTFLNTLDMATGRYRSPDTWADEHADYGIELHLVETHARKLRHSCTTYPRREPPGRRWIYRTPDTYVLGTALQAFVRDRLGRDKELYDDVMVAGLWRPLRLGPALDFTRRTYDAAAQPFTGWGLVLHGDDLARLSRWLATGEGGPQPAALLDPALLAAAMQRSPADRGLVAMDERTRYQHGFYGYDVGPDIGCAAPAWVPYMAGYGGIIVALFPNGSVYYHVSDGNSFRWTRAAVESSRIRSYCGDRPDTGRAS